MEAKKTKTGKWTCCAYYKDADGIIRRPRFTADRKKDAERMAEACSLEHKDDYILAKRGKLPITFADAGKSYIKNRENVLSPSTLVGYQNMLNRAYEMIAGQNIYDLTQEQVQSLVNLWTANGCSPKTVRNQHGFLAAVLTAYRPDFILHTHLPRAIRKDLYTPTDQDVKKLLAAIKGTRMEIPVLLAATGSLRRSEICALDAADVGDGFVRVNKALVWSPSKEWVLKTTKTEAGTLVPLIQHDITRLRWLVTNPQIRAVVKIQHLHTALADDPRKALLHACLDGSILLRSPCLIDQGPEIQATHSGLMQHPAGKTGTPAHSGLKSVPAPVLFPSGVADLALRDSYNLIRLCHIITPFLPNF